MNEEAGRIIDIAKENAAIPGCTVSKQLYHANDNSIFYFSLAKETQISAEVYEYPKLYIIHEGAMEAFDTEGGCYTVKAGDSILMPTKVPTGVRTKEGCIYTEISFRKDSTMNQILKAGEVFQLGELLPYQEGKIVNMDLVSEEKLKFVIMSFDEGTGLSEHAAPGEALVFALDGEGVIGYEGKEYPIKAGETFKFDKLGKHSVKATKKFKMALLLVLD